MAASNRPEWDVILRAAQKNVPDKIRQLVEEYDVSPDHANGVGQSALHVASLWGHVESVRVLLQCGANPNVQNTITGATPLHAAIQSQKASSLDRQVSTIRLLLEAHADPTIVDFYNNTPADYCRQDDDGNGNGNEEPLMALLQVEAPPIFVAIQNENVKELQDILQDDKKNSKEVVQLRHEGLTPLMCVVDSILMTENNQEKGETTAAHEQMLKLLLEHGADPNETTTTTNLNDVEHGTTSLHRICVALKDAISRDNDSDVVKKLERTARLLYEYDATVLPETQQLLHDAARRNQVDFGTFLIRELNVSPNVRGRQGMTPLQFASRSGKVQMVQFLLSQEGIDVSIQDDRGQTALDAATANDKKEIIALLKHHNVK